MHAVSPGNLDFRSLAHEGLAKNVELECCAEALSVPHNIPFVYYGKIPVLILRSG